MKREKREHRSIPLQVKTAPILMTGPLLTEQMSIVKLCGLYLWQQTNVQQCPALSMVSTQNCPEKQSTFNTFAWLLYVLFIDIQEQQRSKMHKSTIQTIMSILNPRLHALQGDWNFSLGYTACCQASCLRHGLTSQERNKHVKNACRPTCIDCNKHLKKRPVHFTNSYTNTLYLLIRKHSQHSALFRGSLLGFIEAWKEWWFVLFNFIIFFTSYNSWILTGFS